MKYPMQSYFKSAILCDTVMVDVNIWILLLTGFVAGILGAMLGIGGGVIIVPALTIVLGVPIHYAIGNSLVAIVANALTSTGIYIKNRMANLKLGLLLSCTLVPGAVVGAFLSSILPGSILAVFFAALLIYVAFNIYPLRKHGNTTGEFKMLTDTCEKEHDGNAWLDESYYDPALHEELRYRVHRQDLGLITGFFGGCVSSLLGIGGGIINVPVMNMVMKVPIKATIATSSLLLCFTTMAGSIVYAFRGLVLPNLMAPLTVGIYIGARTGTVIVRRIQGVWLQRMFAVILIVTAITMVLKVCRVY